MLRTGPVLADCRGVDRGDVPDVRGKAAARVAVTATERGRLAVEDVPRLFNSETDIPAKLTAPPSGLFLEKVYYGGEQRRSELKPVFSVTHERQ